MPFIAGSAQASQLYSYYPWVERYCLKLHCIEELHTIYNNQHLILHTVQFEKYRTEQLYNSTSKIRICSF